MGGRFFHNVIGTRPEANVDANVMIHNFYSWGGRAGIPAGKILDLAIAWGDGIHGWAAPLPARFFVWLAMDSHACPYVAMCQTVYLIPGPVARYIGPAVSFFLNKYGNHRTGKTL